MSDAGSILAAIERITASIDQPRVTPDRVFIHARFFDDPEIRAALIEAKRAGLAHIHPQVGAIVGAAPPTLPPLALALLAIGDEQG